MSTQAINDFLTKQLFIEKNIVTYRSLSRELALHVNAAKNELATYHAKAASQSAAPAATYLIIGETAHIPAHYDEDSAMAVEYDASESQNFDMDTDTDMGIPETKILLVTETEVEGAKSQFRRIHAIHMYSLSPSLIRDAGLLCGPTEIVRQIDNSEKGPEMAVIVGKVLSSQVQMKAGISTAKVASSSKAKQSTKPLSSEKADKKEKLKEKEPVKQTVKDKETPIVAKPKPTGKLDFSKAKTKETKREEAREVAETNTAKEGKKVKAPTSNVEAEQVLEKQLRNEGPKRGTKRKSAGPLLSDTGNDDTDTVSDIQVKAKSKVGPSKGKVKVQEEDAKRRVKRKSLRTPLSDDDDDNTSATSGIQSKETGRARLRKGVILSDDEDIPQPSRRKSKQSSGAASKVVSEAERSLRAMMDIDDDQVTRVSRLSPGSPIEAEEAKEANEDEDVDMTDNVDLAPIPKPKRKKVQKVIPLGRNGLKKKRVVKSRRTTDDAGYMVVEDYSSYESVDEEEKPEPKKSTKKKKSVAEKEGEDDSPATGNSRSGSKEAAPPTKPIPRGAKSTKSTGGSKLRQKGSIANFFGPAKNK